MKAAPGPLEWRRLRRWSRRLPQVGSALIAERCSNRWGAAFVAEFGGGRAGAARTGTAGGGVDAGAAGGASGVTGCGGGLAASRVSYPHFTQKIPLTGAPHLLQKLAMSAPSSTSAFREKLPGASASSPEPCSYAWYFSDCDANV